MKRCARSCRVLAFAFCGVMGAVLGACNLNAFAADQAGGIAAASVAHMRGFWDYEIAGHGNAAGIMQLESLYGLSPDNEDLAMTLCASYVGYAFGWVEVEAEQADDAGDYDRAEQERLRAELLYRRARDIAVRSMRNRDTGIDQALRGRQDQLKAYLQKHYDDPEDDVGLVFWAAASWGGLLGMSDDASLAMDLPAIVAMVQHVASLDPGYEDAGALVFLGGFNSQFPAQFGGSPQKGREYFERALSITDRRAHQVHLNYARLYAVTVGDRELFLALTREIIDAPDQGSSVRLANKIARRRAQLLLSRVDMLF